jgi:hypothetical protein
MLSEALIAVSIGIPHIPIGALLEIELSLLEFAVSTMRSFHAIEVSVVRDRISRSVS